MEVLNCMKLSNNETAVGVTLSALVMLSDQRIKYQERTMPTS